MFFIVHLFIPRTTHESEFYAMDTNHTTTTWDKSVLERIHFTEDSLPYVYVIYELVFSN